MAVRKTKKRSKASEPTDRLLPKLTIGLFNRPKTVFAVWLVILVFGATSYLTFLRREGFPSINIPVAVVSATYAGADAGQVDQAVAKPISEIALSQPGVSMISSQSNQNFAAITVQYEQSVDGAAATKALEDAVKSSGKIPTNVSLTYSVPYFGATGPSLRKLDAAISFYQVPSSSNTADLVAKAEQAVAYLNERKPALVESFFVQKPFESAVNPADGQVQQIQKSFDQFGVRENGETKFYNSVIIGVAAVEDVDVIKLDRQLEAAISDLSNQTDFKDYQATISASFAPAIEDSISELQRVLIEGLLAVLIVGSIIIAVRASLITVMSMITVIAATLGLLFLAGYTLNVITLFALILGLSLIVDDTIIMVEAIDAARRKTKSPKQAVKTAVRKISRAMVAATSTAALSFLPLAFVSGVLGSFIRAIPITIISALIISLFVALIFIPFFARFLLLGKKQMGETGVTEVAANVEASIARTLTKPMHWARGSMKRLWVVGMSAVAIGLLFIGGAGMVFKEVTFNLFPPSKDTNQLSINLTFPAGSSIENAQKLAFDADKVIADKLGKEFDIATYYGAASAQAAALNVELTPYTDREPSAKALAEQLQPALSQALPGVNVAVGQVDIGPPASAFNVQIKTENREAGYKLATAIADYLKSEELKRANNTTARFNNVSISSENSIVRSQARQVIQVSAGFDADDTTTLVTLAQNALKAEFPEDRIANQFGLNRDALQFDLGQEAENQESFKGLVLAFPIVLIVIFLLLAIEFRSLLQPLLIFMAIPFSLFGIVMGLFLTNNAFSFFCAMGFFALIGLSIKNTILVVDYANQARRSGMGAIDAATAALEERFRPLIATSLTAVVSLIPLALSSPFWQGLAVVLIGGLLSSTFLVVTVFPYYYLGGEYLRARISRKAALLWLVSSVVVVVIASRLFDSGSLVIGLLYVILYPVVHAVVRKQRMQSK